MELKRAYKGKNVDMLVTCSTIIEHAVENQLFLVEKRPDWADPYLPDLQERINNAFTNIIGVNNANALKTNTRALLHIQNETLDNLRNFNTQLKVAFYDNKEQLKVISDTLGLSQWYKKSMNKKQEALINLLLLFKNNLSEELHATITGKGVPASLLESITASAEPMKTANIAQEQAKGSRKELSQSAQDELNDIYIKVIGISKISRIFFANDKAKKELFSYSKTLSKLSTTSSNKSTEETELD